MRYFSILIQLQLTKYKVLSCGPVINNGEEIFSLTVSLVDYTANGLNNETRIENMKTAELNRDIGCCFLCFPSCGP